MKPSFAALSLVILLSALPFSSHARTNSLSAGPTDPSVAGPFKFQTAEYKFPAAIDAEVLTTAATELWARVFWPTDLSKPRPIVFMLHGNHATCGGGTPRYDSGCSYTQEGTCPAGQVVVPSHEGYNYLGQQLASLGYIVVTINANRGITCGSGNANDFGLNLARGRLVLRHIEQWQQWATKGGAPASLGLPQDSFIGHVDLGQVGLLGHSRGGEGMRAALNLFRDKGSAWPARIPDLQIRGLFEIGSVDGQTGRVLDADNVAWNQLLPMCDGDVSDLEGKNPFERMIKKPQEIRLTPKSLTMVYGANHNFFNTEWNENEGATCQGHTSISGDSSARTSDAQQKIASTEVAAFFLANVGKNKVPALAGIFDPAFALPTALTSITRIDRAHIYTYDEMFSAIVDDFEQTTGTSSSHIANSAAGVVVANSNSELVDHESVKWSAAGVDHFVQSNWSQASSGRDISTFTSLDFRVGRTQDQMTLPATDFSVVLVDAQAQLSTSVPVSRFANVTGPANPAELYQTVRIPIAEFHVSPTVKIQGVRFVFNSSTSGSLQFANLRFTRNDPAAFENSLAHSVSLADPVVPPAEVPPAATSSPVGNSSNNSPNNVPVVVPGVQPVIASARFRNTTYVARSPYQAGEPSYEIAVSAQNRFPVQAALPVLVLAGNQFRVSRYPDNGKTNTLIFSVKASEFNNLPQSGSMRVQYGTGAHAHQIWKMKNYNKATLSP